MAATHKTPGLDITSEERLAQFILKRHKLTPPFDLEVLVRQYADLAYDKVPDGIDGISLFLKRANKKPKIIISSKISPVRQKFTLAHELGHVLIPWHLGTVFSNAANHDDLSTMEEDDEYLAIEAEANSFASELLIPSDWFRKNFSLEKPATNIGQVAQIQGISVDAAMMKIARLTAPGWTIVTLESGLVKRIYRSPGTKGGAHLDGLVDCHRYSKLASERDSTEVMSKKLLAWKFPIAVELPLAPKDHRDWREVLDNILIAAQYNQADKAHVKQSLNGLIGVAYTEVKRDDSQDFGALVWRSLASKDYASKLLRQPDFKIFLAKKLQSLRDKQRS